jgi:polyisoprenoid-binding protein YceI
MGRYRIDARQSRFVVRVEASGLLSVFGHNPVIAVCGFGGDVQFNAEAPDRASLLLLVQAASLAVAGEVTEKDRSEIERMMRDEVLEAARYPEVVFMSTSVSMNQVNDAEYQARIKGSLSLHGVTRNHEIDAQIILNGNTLRAQGEFPLRQSDYNIGQVSVMGGTLKVKDEVKLSFDIVGEQG